MTSDLIVVRFTVFHYSFKEFETILGFVQNLIYVYKSYTRNYRQKYFLYLELLVLTELPYCFRIYVCI